MCACVESLDLKSNTFEVNVGHIDCGLFVNICSFVWLVFVHNDSIETVYRCGVNVSLSIVIMRCIVLVGEVTAELHGLALIVCVDWTIFEAFV